MEERFDERLRAMLANTSRYFGRNSGRLVRQFQRATRSDFGELRALGVVADTPAQEQ